MSRPLPTAPHLLAAEALRQALRRPLTEDELDDNADLADEFYDLQHAVESTGERLGFAELYQDQRTWSRDDTEEYTCAKIAAEDAWDHLQAFLKLHPEFRK
jgi:hypothetical protein